MHRFTENKTTIISLWSAALLLSLCCVAPSAHAANFITVNSTADDLIGGDAKCTLREAINNANNDGVDQTAGDCVIGAGADTVVIPAGTYTFSITASGDDANLSGDFDTTDISGITIQGAGAASTIIDGGGYDRVLHAVLGPITIDGVTVTGGSVTGVADAAVLGGGIYALNNVNITNSTIAGNTASCLSVLPGPVYGLGGGLATMGVATIANSTISGNSATGTGTNPAGSGGGVYANTVDISNSTISGNSTFYSVGNSMGGGVLAANGGTVVHSTFVGNASYLGGGLSSSGVATFTVSHTIFAANTAAGADTNCGQWDTFTSGGYNIEDANSCVFAGTGDLANTDPMIGSLANNGGGTFTHKLLAGSPAIDIYTSATCATATDQRGVPRPQGSGCDSGAFELSPADGVIAAISSIGGGCVIGPVEQFGPALPVILLLLAGVWWLRRRSE